MSEDIKPRWVDGEPVCHLGCPRAEDNTTHDGECTLTGCDLMVGDPCVPGLRQQLDEYKARFTASIVCMCGSTKFKQAWITENARLTGEGNIVLAVGLWGHHERKYPDAETKAFLDDLHKRKIDLCDWVWVLDVGGYIGESTRSEIDYAKKLGRPIRYLSKDFPSYIEPVDPLITENTALKARLERVREWEQGERRKCRMTEAGLGSCDDCEDACMLSPLTAILDATEGGSDE
jgi:hypothetical protein